MNRVLYHGTDARISLMSDEDRKAFRQDIFGALDYMWNLMEPYFQKFDDRQNILASAYKKGWNGKGSTN